MTTFARGAAIALSAALISRCMRGPRARAPAARIRYASSCPARLGAEFANSTPEEFDRFVKRELAVWSKVVKEVGIRID